MVKEQGERGVCACSMQIWRRKAWDVCVCVCVWSGMYEGGGGGGGGGGVCHSRAGDPSS